MEASRSLIERFRKLNGADSLKLLSGPVAAAIILMTVSIDPSDPMPTRMLAIVVWMALWWIFEAVPVPVTALLPVVLYPLTGIMSTRVIAPFYMNDVIFLFIGGFLLAIAMEKWDLHRRIALLIISRVGSNPAGITLSFMLAAYFLSMWISNTATIMMLLPTVLAVIKKIADETSDSHKTTVALLLATAYSSSIGGTATLIGTPPNLIFLSIYERYFPEGTTVTFANWFFFSFPLSVILLVSAFFVIKFLFLRKIEFNSTLDKSFFQSELKKLGSISFEEKAVLLTFVTTAFLWFFRSDIEVGLLTIPGWSNLLSFPENITDGTVAVFMATILFLISSKKDSGDNILSGGDLKKIPYGVILLFGGGFALAEGFGKTGLSDWMALQATSLDSLPPILMVLLISLFINFMTEITSNTAASQIFLPVLVVVSQSLGINPLLVMIPVTICASYAFMLPVATPANIIVFGSGKIKVKEMVKTGFILNIIGSVLATLIMSTWGRIVFGI